MDSLAQDRRWSFGREAFSVHAEVQRSRCRGHELVGVSCSAVPLASAQGASWECSWRRGKPSRDVRADFPVGSPVLDELCEARAPGLLVKQRSLSCFRWFPLGFRRLPLGALASQACRGSRWLCPDHRIHGVQTPTCTPTSLSFRAPAPTCLQVLPNCGS